MEAGFNVANAFAMAQAYSDGHQGKGSERVNFKVAHYADRGTSSGMMEGFERHRKYGAVIEERYLGGDWSN